MERRELQLKIWLTIVQVQLKPLMDQVSWVKDMPVPEFGSLQAWEARASAAGRAANGDINAGDSKISQLGYNGAPMPYSGDTKVVVDFNGTEVKGEGVKSENESASLKVLPPWMITSGMNLTKEQRGEVKQETKMDGTSASAATQYTDDKKSMVEHDDNKNIQDEYIKAYYAAFLKQQHEMEEAAKNQLSNTHAADDPSSSTSNRQVGMKSKREDDEEDDDGTEWAEAPIGGNGNEGYKVNDLNVQADDVPPDDEEEDDVDWEEG
ncbi:uncharacterized protein LOC133308593 [Gastrolobium bilobum]|uniref:uncharacterized protein LOC133308593 n=1 Tax=Gastrolobium bilobum TaxID=150636 RepID=UPI002AB0303A|nr:uncharacterized protein LOC133308593 [Gastrolobium bilobum]